ncbi:hypothetical protein [Streptomyces aureoverticillatus]|uniref:hypothetical protein n=1 Tax=Streptomyces aureoverticillatus TaxID=66871 RepID=UPI0013DCB7CA|nr:hypothetical protein [Streptomyces aureoverticillatus]QIB42820.1 hypothetical protein G3H79_06820 [Streptomyces aureoverticillatus]
MTYVVTVDTCIPADAPEMDPLQRVGAVAILENGLDSVDGIDGPDDMEVDVLEKIVAVYPGGALLKVFVDAPALEFAEDAVRSVVGELLERSELLGDWTIDRCEVELHPDLAQESLAAADGPDAPPEDPASRKAFHAERHADGDVASPYDAEAKAKAVRARMLALSDDLRSFPLVMFGVPDEEEEGGDYEFSVSPENARLAAGALVYATDLMVDELFEDVQVLTQEETNVGECEGPLWVLEHLPERYALQYDAVFARRFLVTVIAMTTRFTNGSFGQLSCVAEELALRLLLNETSATLELFGLLDDGLSAALESFADNVYEDMDHEWLYDGSMDGIDESDAGVTLGVAPMGFGAWFTPFSEDRFVHPSAVDEPEGGE